MSRSILSHKLCLTDLVQQLTETQCVDVIRLICDALQFKDLNELLINIIHKLTNNTTKSGFMEIENVIKDLLNSHNNDNNNTKNDKTVKGKTKNDKTNLFRLPIDLLNKTSLFLDETDVFHFEQCCKLFYQIINNASHLKQSNNFKTLQLTHKRLNQMLQTQYSFYKYSFAHTLQLQDYDNDLVTVVLDRHIPPFVTQFEKKLHKAQDAVNCNECMESLFKSIKLISCDHDGCLLLCTLPIDQLFDDNSHLQQMRLDHGWTGDKFKETMDKFEEKYLNLKKRLTKEGKRIKVLDCIKHEFDTGSEYQMNVPYQLACIEAKHTSLQNLRIDLGNWDWNHNSSLKILTLDANSFIYHHDKIRDRFNGQIETLRIIGHDFWMYCDNSLDIFYKEKLIESLNLHNSLKNLIVEVITWAWSNDKHLKHWQEIISNLLVKKHYFNVDNLIILFKIERHDEGEILDFIFNLLKKHVKVLKHQFKQLNIGIKQNNNMDEYDKYQIIEWNCNTDAKKLEQARKKWKIDRESLECDKDGAKYLEFRDFVQ